MVSEFVFTRQPWLIAFKQIWSRAFPRTRVSSVRVTDAGIVTGGLASANTTASETPREPRLVMRSWMSVATGPTAAARLAPL